jgi:hypothetical protein
MAVWQLRQYATSQKAAGSRSDEVNEFYPFSYNFWPPQALGFTQPLTGMSTRSKNKKNVSGE